MLSLSSKNQCTAQLNKVLVLFASVHGALLAGAIKHKFLKVVRSLKCE